MTTPRYCCKRHTPPFRARLLAEVRAHWRGHLGRAIGPGLLLAALAAAILR